MPQDGLRSAVYRSFVTCDDPKGVVDCGMIRKSKTGSPKTEQKKMEGRRKSKNSRTSLDHKAEKDVVIAGEYESPSSFQLMEVSRGAQKLNRTIDSWSNGIRFEGQQPKDIAKDLLKGALDLQDSLVMLGKLQEASQYMSHLKQKHNSVKEFEKPRRSADGFSRGGNEELKKVIRDSFASQQLVENTESVERGYSFFPRRYMDSCLDTPSSSSSQSSMFHTASDSTIATSAAPQKEGKGPSLIAKLMGIEEYPSRPSQAALKKKIDHGEKILSSQQRPMFDIDRPKVMKPQTSAQNVDHENRTLREVLETMRFKGLLKGSSVEEHRPDFLHSNHSDSTQRFTRDSPPIVLIRPLSVSSMEPEEPRAPLVRGEEAFYTKEMLKSMGTKEGALKSKKMHRKMKADGTPSKRLDQEERAKNQNVAAQKPEEREAKTKEKASRKLKASHPADHKPQRKEAIDKKVDKIHKVTAVSRNSPEKDIEKSKNVLKSQDLDKLTSAKARKHESGSNITKSSISRQPNTATITISKSSTQNVASNSNERKRNHLRKEKSVKEPTVAKTVTKNVVSEESEKRIIMDDKSDASLIRSNADLTNENPKEEEKDAYGSQSGGHCSNFESSVCDATPLSPKQEIETKTAEEASEHMSRSAENGKSFESGENFGHFLLSNPSFLSLAEELFDLNMDSPTILQTSSIYNFEESDRILFLDCAKELIECKSVHDSQTVNLLLLTCQGKPRICVSVDQLVEEVCYWIEKMQNYSKLAGERLLADSLYLMLESDIMCRGVVNGTWDSGWRNGFSRYEVEQLMSDIEKLVLDGLIEEVFA